MSKRTVDVDDLAARMEAKFPPPERKRGRPAGSKNRIEVPSEAVRLANIEHTDPLTLCERQFVIAEWLQSAYREELKRRMKQPNIVLTADDVKRFESITVSLDRATNTARRALDTAEELANRMTAEQLLQAALKKIQAQDPAFVRYAIKVLKAHLDLVVPKADPDRVPLGTAVDAMAALMEDE